MDDELKTMLSILLDKVETVSVRVETINARVETIAKVQEEHGEVLEKLQRDVVDVKVIAGSNYISLKGRIDQVGDMFIDHIADYHTTTDRKRA